MSFWRFMSNEHLAAKAHATTERGLRELGLAPGDLGHDDYLLGCRQDVPGSYRYCHHFCEREVDALLAGLGDQAQPVARFTADGRSGVPCQRMRCSGAYSARLARPECLPVL